MNGAGFFDIGLRQTISQWLTIPFLLLLGVCLFGYFMLHITEERVDKYLSSRISVVGTDTR